MHCVAGDLLSAEGVGVPPSNGVSHGCGSHAGGDEDRIEHFVRVAGSWVMESLSWTFSSLSYIPCQR